PKGMRSERADMTPTEGDAPSRAVRTGLAVSRSLTLASASLPDATFLAPPLPCVGEGAGGEGSPQPGLNVNRSFSRCLITGLISTCDHSTSDLSDPRWADESSAVAPRSEKHDSSSDRSRRACGEPATASAKSSPCNGRCQNGLPRTLRWV